MAAWVAGEFILGLSMAKNILAFLGLVFLTLIILVCVLVVGEFYDQLGFISLPKGWIETPMHLLTPGPATVEVHGVGKAEWTNPLDALPITTPEPNPTPTLTPVPPMDPMVYQSEVVSHMQLFADALKRWLEANNQLADNNAVMQDPTWMANMKVILENVATSGSALAEIDPAPAEYQSIDNWLKKIGPEATGLKENYQKALDNSDAQAFVDASHNFSAIQEDLTQAVNEMIKAGWILQ